MAGRSTTPAPTIEREYVFKREFDAPRSLVFKAWTDPALLARWWGPHGFTNPVCEIDGRPGGAIRIHMRAPDGAVYPMTGEFREVVEPERLVFLSAALDASGTPIFEVLTTVTFAERSGRTLLTVRAQVVRMTPEADPYLAGMNEGWKQSLERLQSLADRAEADDKRQRRPAMNSNGTLQVMTPSDREIVITREFDAPRRLVWDAMTKPEFLKRWLFSPPGWDMAVCEEDVRVGGGFRWAWTGADGNTAMVMHGAYREVKPFDRIVRIETFEFGCDAQAGEQVGTLEFTERAGKTTMKMTLLFPSKECRDGCLSSGMERGMSEGYDRLDELLASGASREPARSGA